MGRQYRFEAMPRDWIAIYNGTNLLGRLMYKYPILLWNETLECQGSNMGDMIYGNVDYGQLWQCLWIMIYRDVGYG